MLSQDVPMVKFCDIKLMMMITGFVSVVLDLGRWRELVETVEDAVNVLKIIPIPAPILDVRIVDDTLEDIHQYLEE